MARIRAESFRRIATCHTFDLFDLTNGRSWHRHRAAKLFGRNVQIRPLLDRNACLPLDSVRNRDCDQVGQQHRDKTANGYAAPERMECDRDDTGISDFKERPHDPLGTLETCRMRSAEGPRIRNRCGAGKNQRGPAGVRHGTSSHPRCAGQGCARTVTSRWQVPIRIRPPAAETRGPGAHGGRFDDPR